MKHRYLVIINMIHQKLQKIRKVGERVIFEL